MGNKIDSQMQQIYNDCVQKGGSDAQLGRQEAAKLIDRAEKCNNHVTSSSFSSAGRGNRYLKRLVNGNPNHFSKESREDIQNYLNTGRPPHAYRSDAHVHTTPNSGHHSVPGHVDHSGRVPPHPYNHHHAPAPTPATPARPSVPTYPSTPTPTIIANTHTHGAGGATMPQPVPNAVNNTFNHPAGGAGAHVHVPATPSIVTPATPASIPVTPSNPVTPAMPSIARPATPGAATVVTPTTPRPSVGTVIMPGGAVVEPRIPSTPNAGAGAVVTPPRIPSTPSAGGASNTATPSVPSAGAGTVAPSVPSTPSIGVSPAAGTIAPSAPAAGSSIPATPVNPASPVNPATPASPSPVPAPDLVPHSNVGSGVVGAHGKEIINFQAAKATWGCHWFPLQESKVGGDHINNLYAVGGCLDKLDALTGGSARQYEFEHNRKPFGSGQQYSWWGHCNNASEAACILRAPQHDVVMKGANGNEVRFTKNDIQGLLVKVAPSLVNGVDFKGERYNGTRDNPQDPKPELFLQVMKEWTKDGLPFVLDIDNREQVWNFPYDKVKIYESDRAPQGFSGSIEGEGTVTYYHIEMAGTGFDKKARIYECYIQKNSSGAVVSSAWIKTGNTHNNPDFMWRPHPVGDITDKSVWKLKSKPSNPQVDPQVVYDIYMKSLA